ncbi:MAG: hypothetical protein AAFV53_28550 [Myxococcota bacterium]
MTVRSILFASVLACIFSSVAAADTLQGDGTVEIHCEIACSVTITDAPAGGLYVIARDAEGERWERFAADAISQVRFIGSAANDVLIVDAQTPLAVEAHGRGGDDYLSGNSENDILVGGPGRDVIEAGESSDLCALDEGDMASRCDRR